jgi:hypothetical protein
MLSWSDLGFWAYSRNTSSYFSLFYYTNVSWYFFSVFLETFRDDLFVRYKAPFIVIKGLGLA